MIKFNNVTFGYGKKKIFKNLTFLKNYDIIIIDKIERSDVNDLHIILWPIEKFSK